MVSVKCLITDFAISCFLDIDQLHIKYVSYSDENITGNLQFLVIQQPVVDIASLTSHSIWYHVQYMHVSGF